MPTLVLTNCWISLGALLSFPRVLPLSQTPACDKGEFSRAIRNSTCLFLKKNIFNLKDLTANRINMGLLQRF